MNDKNPISSVELLLQAEGFCFEVTPSTLLADAVAAYESSQDPLAPAEDPKVERAWGVLARQVIGHETF
jgi:hypothetical protein